MTVISAKQYSSVRRRIVLPSPFPIRAGMERDPELFFPGAIAGQDGKTDHFALVHGNKNDRSGFFPVLVQPAAVPETIIKFGKFRRILRPGPDDRDILIPERAERDHGIPVPYAAPGKKDRGELRVHRSKGLLRALILGCLIPSRDLPDRPISL